MKPGAGQYGILLASIIGVLASLFANAIFDHLKALHIIG
jgi:hypothetical protein